MAQSSGFFNALQQDGVYDRRYNANDYSDNLAVVIGNGVLRSINDDLKVTSAGMIPTVAAGRAWINGHYYINDSPLALTPVSAPAGGNRYDRVMLRLDTSISTRSISVVYVQGTASASPVKPAPTRSGNIYDLVLADVYVAANATSITITDTRADASICGWLYSTSGDNSFFTSLDNSFNEWFQGAKDTLSSVTLFKKYTQLITLAAAGSTVSFNIPQYDPDTCFAEVYVNGIFDNRHTISNNVITFEGTLIAGTKVTVNVYKSIDGTGIMSVADEITQLQNQVAALSGISKFTYICTGVNDNIALSQIAQAIYAGSYTVGSLSAAAEAFLQNLGGNTYLASLTSECQITIDVSGKLGATSPAAGTGTTSSRYRWFNLGLSTAGSKRVIFDFLHCDQIDITCAANSYNLIFYGTDINLRNCRCYAHGTSGNTDITMVTSDNMFGRMTFDKCFFKIVTNGYAIIGEAGEWTNCILHAKSVSSHSYCILVQNTNALVQMTNCTLSAYTATASKDAGCLGISSAATNGVILSHNINAPVIAQSGYSQKNLIISNGGFTLIHGVCSTLPSAGDATKRTISGQIQKNKH